MVAGTETLALSSASGVQRFLGFINLIFFQYLFTYNSNKLDVGKTSTEAPRLSPHLGCQGPPGLDMLNAYNKYIISIYKVLRNRSNYINNTYNIIMLYTL